MIATDLGKSGGVLGSRFVQMMVPLCLGIGNKNKWTFCGIYVVC